MTWQGKRKGVSCMRYFLGNLSVIILCPVVVHQNLKKLKTKKTFSNNPGFSPPCCQCEYRDISTDGTMSSATFTRALTSETSTTNKKLVCDCRNDITCRRSIVSRPCSRTQSSYRWGLLCSCGGYCMGKVHNRAAAS